MLKRKTTVKYHSQVFDFIWKLVIGITDQLIPQNGKKLRGVQEEQQRAQNTSLRHLWHHVNQFATTTIHHDILWPIREKLCQNRQHWTTNSHKKELEENPLMVDHVKSGTKADLNYSSLLPISKALCRVCTTQRRASQVPRPFLWGNWVVGSTPLHSMKRPRRTDTRRSKTLGQCRC